MKLLVTGPPGSGKTSAVLASFRKHLGEGILLSPTATMAQHLQNELARAGDRVRPGRIVTLSNFVEPWASRWRPVTTAALEVIVDEALQELRCPTFEDVLEFRGFRQAVVGLLEELSASGRETRTLRDIDTPFAADLARLVERIEGRLAGSGMALRGARLKDAAEAIRSAGMPGIRSILVDGFYTLTAPELDVLDALAGHAELTITLPAWAGAEPARRALLARGFTESIHEQCWRNPERETIAAPTMVQETEEIARRILNEAAGGRAFRQIGILVRARDPYVPALRSTLDRFGIPARFNFAENLAAHPAVSFVSGVVRCLLGGWDHQELLGLLRLPVSGVGSTPAGDRFDFAVRERLPGRGLPSFLKLAGDPDVAARLELLQRVDGWGGESLAASRWLERFASLRELLPPPRVEDGVTHERALLWRSWSAALDAFDRVVAETAEALKEAGAIRLAEFWRPLEDVLADTPLRAADSRRNVVHVLDVYEARQWELPVVFVCGLLERQFPQYHTQDPILGDTARRKLGLRTSDDRQREERFLFDLAATRSTERLVLSYPRFDEKGEEQIPSFFLASDSGRSVADEACGVPGTRDRDVPRGQRLRGVEAAPCPIRIRPRPARAWAPERATEIFDEELRARLEGQHRRLSPSAIESFLQCPYQFFARHTLRLTPRPAAPRERLDVMTQGSIIHRVLAEMARYPLFHDALFDQVFDEECSIRRIPRTYRAEAVRLEMLGNLQAFVADRKYGLRWPSVVETEFTLPLAEGLAIRGRIDRIDTTPDGAALVIDYKYSSAGGVRHVVDENQDDTKVQGGLYLLAAERELGYKPAGMMFCGLRGSVTWAGWHVAIPGLENVGTACQPDVLRERMEGASQKAVEVHAEISRGRVRPAPADRDKCRYCDFRDICRVESQVEVVGARSGPPDA